jgi:hypothetical protein
MIVKILFGQRKESYNIGANSPEALECVSIEEHEANPQWIQSRLEFHQSNNEFKALTVIDVEVDGKHLEKILNPSLPGTIITNSNK